MITERTSISISKINKTKLDSIMYKNKLFGMNETISFMLRNLRKRRK